MPRSAIDRPSSASALWGRFWRVLRWLPAASLALMGVVAWATLLGGGMSGAYAYLVLMAGLPPLALLTLLGTLVYAVIKRRFSAPVWVTRLVALVLLWPGAWFFNVATIRYPGSIEEAQPAATVRVPFAEPVRVFWGGDDVRSNYHAAYPDQRWAYDLVLEPLLTGSARLEDYGCYGKVVLAPADARVQLAHDGAPDAVPGQVDNASSLFGNVVSLELGTGTHLVFAHLQPGSVSVRAGEQVREGQPIARCGNSGRTSEPHLHLHHQRQPLDLAKPIAEGLPLFFRDHDGPPMPSGGVRVDGERVEAIGAVIHHVASAAPAPSPPLPPRPAATQPASMQPVSPQQVQP